MNICASLNSHEGRDRNIEINILCRTSYFNKLKRYNIIYFIIFFRVLCEFDYSPHNTLKERIPKKFRKYGIHRPDNEILAKSCYSMFNHWIRDDPSPHTESGLATDLFTVKIHASETCCRLSTVPW